MRKQLKTIENGRDTFQGTFERFGEKSGFRGGPLRTVLLTLIRHKASDQIVADHLWFNDTKAFQQLILQKGDVVEFDARMKKYQKGYMGFRAEVIKPISTDYKLSHPTKVKKVVVQQST